MIKKFNLSGLMLRTLNSYSRIFQNLYSVFFFLIFNFLFLASYLFLPTSIYASSHTFYFGPIETTYDDAGKLMEEKVYYPAGNVTAVKTISNQQTATNYLFPDHLGSTVLVTRDDGTVDSSFVYYPFGSLETGNRQPATDHLYTGQILDSSTSLYFYNARYYNPRTGHFISADKAEGPNRYAYVSNNPIMRNDPSGHSGLGPAVDALTAVFANPEDLGESVMKITADEYNSNKTYYDSIGIGGVEPYKTYDPNGQIVDMYNIYYLGPPHHVNDIWYVAGGEAAQKLVKGVVSIAKPVIGGIKIGTSTVGRELSALGGKIDTKVNALIARFFEYQSQKALQAEIQLIEKMGVRLASDESLTRTLADGTIEVSHRYVYRRTGGNYSTLVYDADTGITTQEAPVKVLVDLYKIAQRKAYEEAVAHAGNEAVKYYDRYGRYAPDGWEYGQWQEYLKELKKAAEKKYKAKHPAPN